jgi:SAM-dependent methyltransferase
MPDERTDQASTAIRDAYDAIPYPGLVHPQSHPDRLAVAARLLGLAPASPEGCRVLELGCGDGTNLLAMAIDAPGSEFVGIDLAPTSIDAARDAARETGAANTTFLPGDIARLPDGLGRFDYVIAHGVYSWVPAPVRDALLAASRRLLTDQGVAYVSYAVYPGAYLRRAFRDIMRYHVREVNDAQTATTRAVDFLGALAEALPGDGVWDRAVREAAEELGADDPALVRHDDLADVNEPVWWHEFVRHAEAHGLRYLAEADWRDGAEPELPDRLQAVLDAVRQDRVVREQYLDFLKGRRFRQTLLVRDAIVPGTRALAAPVMEFHLASPAVSVAMETTPDGLEIETFEGARGGRAATDARLVRAALHLLRDVWPRRLPFADVYERARRSCPDGSGDAAFLAEFLLPFHATGLVRFHMVSPRLVEMAGPMPRSHPLVRLQARRQPVITTPLGTALRVDDPLVRQLLVLADGTRDREALMAALAASVDTSGQTGPAVADLTNLDRALGATARHGLFVG